MPGRNSVSGEQAVPARCPASSLFRMFRNPTGTSAGATRGRIGKQGNTNRNRLQTAGHLGLVDEDRAPGMAPDVGAPP